MVRISQRVRNGKKNALQMNLKGQRNNELASAKERNNSQNDTNKDALRGVAVADVATTSFLMGIHRYVQAFGTRMPYLRSGNIFVQADSVFLRLYRRIESVMRKSTIRPMQGPGKWPPNLWVIVPG